MVPTIPTMQPMQLLSSSSVAAAAGSMIWLSFALSPPITLVPERPARPRRRIATRANESSRDAAEAASATIRRLRPFRPVPDRLYTKQSPLLALPASARSTTTQRGKNRITDCICTTAF
jgi:hypothetical protein